MKRLLRLAQTRLLQTESALLQSVPLGQWVGGRNNNLDVLRLLGALLVIYEHGFVLNGLPPRMPRVYEAHIGTIGVEIFFIISGFLITQSCMRAKNPARFLWSRFLRIFPALIVVTLLLAFVLGPLVTDLPSGAYFGSNQTYSYLRTMDLYDVNRVNWLPGVFELNPGTSQANGPLWTLQYEWSFYLVVLVLGLLALLKRKWIVAALFVTSLAMTYFRIGWNLQVKPSHITPVFYSAMFFTYFSFGALAYLLRDRIRMSLGAVLLVLAMLGIAAVTFPFSHAGFVFVLGYLVLFVGLSPGIRLSWLTKYGDFSYGLYIIAWPVQQTVIQYFGHTLNVWAQLGISLAVTLGLAALSWHLLEKRVLRLKQMGFNISWFKARNMDQLKNGQELVVPK